MPRKARLFASSSGSAARGFLKFRANIPPRWIKNAQKSRKRIEPEIVEALHSMISMRRDRPRAQVALKKANHEFKAVLSRWDTAYNKENFYRGIRILLELQRNGSSKLRLSSPLFQVLVDRLGHLKHVQFLTAKDRLQLIVGQDFSFVLRILKVVLLNVRPNLFCDFTSR